MTIIINIAILNYKDSKIYMDNINEILKSKNQELFLNKVNVDLDNYLETTILLLNNYLNNKKESISQEIYEILIDSSNINYKDILSFIESKLLSFKNQLILLISNKKVFLVNNNLTVNLEDFKNNINNQNIVLIEQLNVIIDNLINIIKEEYDNNDNQFNRSRLNNILNKEHDDIHDYLLNSFNEKDLLLINNYNSNIDYLNNINDITSKVK